MYDPYKDPNCPSCDCADWGMMGCLSTCAREVYIKKMNTDINPLLNMSGCETVQPAPAPEKSKESRLLEFVQAQIKKLHIGCRESVHQCDRVILGAYEFIEGCCEIVGYMETDDESI